MTNPVPRNVRSVKSRLDTINQSDDLDDKRVSAMNRVQSHFLVPSDKLEKVTRRVIAPYAQIERKGLKEDEGKEGTYLDIGRFNVFLEDTVDLDSLLYETAMVLKTVTNSSGVFVYTVDKLKNEIVLMARNTNNPERHEVNIPIEEDKLAAAHVAATKQHLLLEDVPKDKRFSEGLKWVDAKTALCMPVVKPDGDCYAVLELYRTFAEPYDNNVVYTAVSVCCWAGAAVHQAQARVTLQRSSHLNVELRALLQKYFCDLASIDTMLTDMLMLSFPELDRRLDGLYLCIIIIMSSRPIPATAADLQEISQVRRIYYSAQAFMSTQAIIKSFIGALRSSFFIVDRGNIDDQLMADMWDDGWATERSALPRKKTKVNLSLEQTPAGLVARTGLSLNLQDVYKDPRFTKEVDPTTGMIVRSSLTSPIIDKNGVIGVVQLINKTTGQPFDADDEAVFGVFVNYCSLIVHFHHMQQKKLYHENLNKIYSELMGLHLKPCQHDIDELEMNWMIVPPTNFRTFEWYVGEGAREELPALVCHMYAETFAARGFERHRLADFVLTALRCYRPNAYHNARHAFCFTHTMYVVLAANAPRFSFVETVALMLAGLCHDLDHPGYNNNFLQLCKHPLAHMYKSSQLENYHYFLAEKIIEDKQLLARLGESERALVLQEMRYAILSTDLAAYFATRAQLAPLVAERAFRWTEPTHRRLLKSILMTTSDLSGCCKPFGVAKAITESIYEEFYEQGDRERALGYTPLSMMDRRRSANQPAEQIQFLSVVVLPCLMLLTSILPNTGPLLDNCRQTQEGWHEEIEMRGMKLWKQEESVAPISRSRVLLKSKTEVNS